MPKTGSLALATCLLLVAACEDAALNEAPQPADMATPGPAATAASPARAAQAFFKAIAADDTAGYEALMTHAAVKALHAEGGSSMSFSADKLESWTVGAESVDGTEAAVEVVITSDGKGQQVSLKLRALDGRWLVHGMAIPMGDDEWLVDFEGGDDTFSEIVDEFAGAFAESMTQAFAGASALWQAGGSAEDIAAGRASYDSLQSVNEDQHTQAWRVDVEAAGRPVAVVMAELLADTGLSMAATDLLTGGSTLSLSGVSRLEAIEALCAEGGVVPLYPSGSMSFGGGSGDLTFSAGTRLRPVVFAGPFMLELTELEEHPPNSTAELTLTARALSLHPALLAANQQMAEYLELDGVSSSDGADLRTDVDAHRMGSPTQQQGLFSYSLSCELKGLLRGVESFTLAGAVAIVLPQDVHGARFPAGQAGGSVQAGDWTVTWDQSGSYNSFTLTHQDGRSAEAGVRFAPDLATGEPMGIQSESASGLYEHVTASLSTPELPAALALKVFAEQQVRYSFRFENIPLERFAQQPLRQEPLDFRGAAPLEVEFTGFADLTSPDFPEVGLSIENQSNLAAKDAQVTFEYFDAGGRSLKDFPHNLAGEFSFEGRHPLAGAGQSTSLELVAFFMPPETATIRVRVESVTFVNGTAWKHE